MTRTRTTENRRGTLLLGEFKCSWMADGADGRDKIGAAEAWGRDAGPRASEGRARQQNGMLQKKGHLHSPQQGL